MRFLTAMPGNASPKTMEEAKKPKRPRIGNASAQTGSEAASHETRFEKINYPGDTRHSSGSPYSGGESGPRPYSPQRPQAHGYSGNSYGQSSQGQYQRPNSYGQQRPNSYGQQRPNTYGQQRQQNGYGQQRPTNGYSQQGSNSYQRPQQNGYGEHRPQQNGYGYQRPQQSGYSPRPNNGYGQQRQQNGYGQQRQQNGYGQQRPNNGYGQQGGHSYQRQQQNGYGQQRPQQNGYGYQRPQQNGYGQQRQQNGYNQNRPQQGGWKQAGPQAKGRPGSGNAKFSPKPKQMDYVLEDIDPNAEVRLNKYMANAGICSRREADEYITSGKVKVNGQTVTELGTKISRNDVVEFNDKVVTPERKCYVLLNKPKDCVTTSDDPNGRTTVLDIVKGACEERIYPVGRLDRNTTGVLLLTNDGDLASKLTHPKFVKKKIYHVWTDKDIAEEDMQRIADGIELEDGEIHADAISYVGDERNQAGIEIHSGRNRIVRRIFEHLGYRVVKLDRVYFAGLTKKNLPRGRWRYLSQEEVNYLRMGAFE